MHCGQGDTVAMGNLSPELTGPVQLELAKVVEHLPGPHGMPGGSRYELKWDGFRAGAVCRDGQVRLWSRNGKDFTAKFPDVQAALAAQLTTDCVLDRELVVWTGDRVDFDALQRMVGRLQVQRCRRTRGQGRLDQVPARAPGLGQGQFCWGESCPAHRHRRKMAGRVAVGTAALVRDRRRGRVALERRGWNGTCLTWPVGFADPIGNCQAKAQGGKRRRRRVAARPVIEGGS